MPPAAHQPRPVSIAALRDPAAWPHPVGTVEIVETHISWVVLTGEYAYKIKKPLDLGFLDFSTLALREQACREELRLNARLAPQLYLDVVPLTGDASAPTVGGTGEAFEYAVQMRQFPGEQELDRLLAAGKLQREDIESAARNIAAFHRAAPADAPAELGTAQAVTAPVLENFRQIRATPEAQQLPELEGLERWSRETAHALEPVFTRRRAQGFVRECHGDLHLANLVKLGEAVVPFDCIEFDPALRWIDIVSDLAFLFMDLRYRGRADLAYACLDTWLAETGDYPGMCLLRFYTVYRALVRAKVALIRATQESAGQTRDERARAGAHLQLAASLMRPARPALILMHGVSGSGKSFVSSELVSRLQCIRVRSDVERKRLAGLDAREAARSGPGAGIYSDEMGERTYARLLDLARGLIEAGERVIVDATFLRASQRTPFVRLARRLRVPLALVACAAAPAELEARVKQRTAKGGDPSDADIRILRAQLAAREVVTEKEAIDMIHYSSDDSDMDALARGLRDRLESGAPRD